MPLSHAPLKNSAPAPSPHTHTRPWSHPNPSSSQEFEKNNAEFCSQFMTDLEERNKSVKKKQDGADTARLRGNAHFKRKEYPLALDKYFEALKLLPYEAKTLLNIAQVCLIWPTSRPLSGPLLRPLCGPYPGPYLTLLVPYLTAPLLLASLSLSVRSVCSGVPQAEGLGRRRGIRATDAAGRPEERQGAVAAGVCAV